MLTNEDEAVHSSAIILILPIPVLSAVYFLINSSEQFPLPSKANALTVYSPSSRTVVFHLKTALPFDAFSSPIKLHLSESSDLYSSLIFSTEILSVALTVISAVLFTLDFSGNISETFGISLSSATFADTASLGLPAIP